MATRRMWLPLSAIQFIEKRIYGTRTKDVECVPENKEVNVLEKLELHPVEDKQLVEDFLFFASKGIKLKYLKSIFEDFKQGEAMSVSSVSGFDKETYGKNRYAVAADISVYAHTISTAKRVFDLEGYSKTELANAALLVLIHDFGKLSSFLKTKGIVIHRQHEYTSALYAEAIISDAEDRNLLDVFVDILRNPESQRRFKGGIMAKILKKVDFEDRAGTQVFKMKEALKK
jgi:hypothetical protein